MTRSLENKNWFQRRWAELSTGLKMMLILSAGLLPLGIIAILASLQNAEENNARRLAETQARVEIKAQRLNSTLSRSALTIRAASAAIARTSADSDICEITLQRLSSVQATAGQYALFAGDGTLRCASPGFLPPVKFLESKERRTLVVHHARAKRR